MKLHRLTTMIACAALVFAASAEASTPTVAWTKKDMTTAIRGLGYPKPHPRKLTCKGLGVPDTVNRYPEFRCVATYRHHRHRRFYTAGRAQGGWLCAGKTVAGCRLLRRGFVTSLEIARLGSQAATAGESAKGYLINHDQFPYQVVHFCTLSDASTYSCPFSVNDVPVTVTMTFRKASGGYVTSASATSP